MNKFIRNLICFLALVSLIDTKILSSQMFNVSFSEYPQLNSSNFDNFAYAQGSRIVFFKGDCHDCQNVKRFMKDLLKEYPQINFATVESLQNQQLAKDQNLHPSESAFVLFYDGVSSGFISTEVYPLDQIRRKIVDWISQ